MSISWTSGETPLFKKSEDFGFIFSITGEIRKKHKQPAEKTRARVIGLDTVTGVSCRGSSHLSLISSYSTIVSGCFE